MSNKDVAGKYVVPKNTLSILGQEQRKNSQIHWKRKQIYFQLDPKYAESKSSIISCYDSIEGTYTCLNVENFEALDCLLGLYKERNRTTYKTALEESKSVTPRIVDMWQEKSLPTLVSNYKLKDMTFTTL